MALTDISHPTDIAMLTDLYELTMAQGLWESGKANEQGCFTAFYRDHHRHRHPQYAAGNPYLP